LIRPRARLDGQCLAQRGVACQVCQEFCPANAIRFRPVVGAVAQPTIDDDLCDGCAECAPACPSSAIIIVETGSGDPA
jgi:ferredoxin-type protein NapF|tara:strand:+ start:921 stop:1154 length:234 start_codon:yes stop_codon:yes gene_type:complete